MNITRENTDDLNVVLKLALGKEDYEERVTNVLNTHKKKAVIPGFRPGKVPFGLISKMYRKPVLLEEINKLVSESISKFIEDEKLNILGEPLPHEGEATKIDWDTDSDFEFKFDLALAPDFELKLSSKDKIPYYKIEVDNEMIDKYIDSYTQRFGEFIHVDTIEEKDMLSVSLVQLNESGEVKDGGICSDESRISVDLIKDESIKSAILKSKIEDTLVVDLKKAYPNDTEIASILKIKSAEAANVSGDFKLAIKDIQRFSKAEVNQELFNKVYGEGNVSSVDDFRSKISEEASLGLTRDSEYKFKIDVKDSMIKKFKSNLPEEFLKRWLFEINQGKFTQEEINKDFDKFIEDLKWQLIKDKIAKDNEIKITEEDIMASAKENARLQFSYYGMSNVPDEHLTTFAQRTLSDDKQARKVAEGCMENKIIEFIKSAVKIEEKEISSEKFNKMFEADK